MGPWWRGRRRCGEGLELTPEEEQDVAVGRFGGTELKTKNRVCQGPEVEAGSVEVIERTPPVQSVSPAVRRSCNRMSRFPRTSLGLP